MSQNNSDWNVTKELVAELFAKFNKYIDGQENSSRPQQLIQFENELSAELNSWGASFDIHISPPDIDAIFKTSTSVLINDGTRTDIARKGHGLQRAVTIALIQLIAKRQLQESENQETTSRSASKSRYFIFEEPELYLHPQAQRALFKMFTDLSNNNQVILCTHSNNLIDLEKYKSIYIVKKENEEIGSKVVQCIEELFDGGEKKKWDLISWINPDRSELFFATKVILVEGATEKAIIPALANRLECFKYDYTVIDCGSKNNIPAYIRLLNKFSIPYVAVYDKDHQTRKSQQDRQKADSDSRKIEELIDTNIGQSIVFVNDIEEELGFVAGTAGKPFTALQKIEEENFSLSNEMVEKINKIYQ